MPRLRGPVAVRGQVRWLAGGWGPRQPRRRALVRGGLRGGLGRRGGEAPDPAPAERRRFVLGGGLGPGRCGRGCCGGLGGGGAPGTAAGAQRGAFVGGFGFGLGLGGGRCRLSGRLGAEGALCAFARLWGFGRDGRFGRLCGRGIDPKRATASPPRCLGSGGLRGGSRGLGGGGIDPKRATASPPRCLGSGGLRGGSRGLGGGGLLGRAAPGGGGLRCFIGEVLESLWHAGHLRPGSSCAERRLAVVLQRR